MAESKPDIAAMVPFRGTGSPRKDATSPTAHQESVVITAAIDAMEGREVAIADIPNAFIQTDNETVEEAMSKGRPPPLMKVRGRVVDMLVRIAPTIYKPFIVYERANRRSRRTGTADGAGIQWTRGHGCDGAPPAGPGPRRCERLP